MNLGLGFTLGGIGAAKPPPVIAAMFTGAGAGAWFDFTDPAALYSDAARATLVSASGQAVLGVRDKSGFGNHLSQATAGSGPLWSTDDGGRLIFDGTDDHLRCDALAALFTGSDPAVTIHYVAQPKLIAAAAQCILGAGSSASNNPTFWSGRNNGSVHQAVKRDSAGASTTVTVGPSGWWYSRRAIVSISFNGTTYDTWVNGERIVTAGALDIDSIALDRFAIGALMRATASAFFSGSMQEALIFPGAQSNANIATVQSYLRAQHMPAPSAVDLLWIIGQSNAEGRGDAVTTPPPAVPAGQAWLYSRSMLHPLASPVGEAASGSAWTNFAIRWYALKGRPLVVVESATGGTGMQADTTTSRWDPDSATLYPAAKADLDAAISFLSARGITIGRRLAVWAQGETDADAINGTTVTAANYQAAFGRLCDAIAADYPTMRILVSELGAPNDGVKESQWAEIRAAQAAVCDAKANADMGYTGCKGFPGASQMTDRLHYNMAGYNLMGTAMADVAAAIP